MEGGEGGNKRFFPSFARGVCVPVACEILKKAESPRGKSFVKGVNDHAPRNEGPLWPSRKARGGRQFGCHSEKASDSLSTHRGCLWGGLTVRGEKKMVPILHSPKWDMATPERLGCLHVTKPDEGIGGNVRRKVGNFQHLAVEGPGRAEGKKKRVRAGGGCAGECSNGTGSRGKRDIATQLR